MPSDTRQFDQRSGGGSGTSGEVTRRMVMCFLPLSPGLAPDAFTAASLFSSSVFTKAVYSAGVMVLDSAPISCQRLITSGFFSTTCISRASRSTIGAGSVRRSRQAEPGIGDEVGIARLLHGRHVGEAGVALLAADRHRAHLAGLDVRRGRGQRIEHRRHVAGHHVLHRGTRAAIGDVDQLGVGHQAQHRAEDVVARARTRGREGELVGIGSWHRRRTRPASWPGSPD